MNDHDRYETLAGAIVLGEATPDERARFDAHAATCTSCRDDAASSDAMRASLDAARDDESWRPSVTGDVRERIAASRGRRTRATVGAFGWAIGISLVLNVAFASGFGGRIATGLRDSGEAVSSIATTRFTFDAKRPAAAPAESVAARAMRQPAPPRALAHLSKGGALASSAHGVGASDARSSHATVGGTHVAAADASSPSVAAGVASASAGAATSDVPDVLAGLDVDPSSARVAVEPLARCERPARDAATFEIKRDGRCAREPSPTESQAP